MEIGVIVADVHITFLEPVYFGQIVRVGVHVMKLGMKSMTWEQNVVEASSDREFARGEVVLVTYDYREGKTIPIPQAWRQRITEFESLAA
jgi:acyl-CoA thioester hydrolase